MADGGSTWLAALSPDQIPLKSIALQLMQLEILLKIWLPRAIADVVLVQVAWVIGLAEPVGLYVNTYGTARVKLNDGESPNVFLNYRHASKCHR